MQWLKDFVSKFFTYLYDGLLWLVDGISTVIQYAVYYIYDGLLTVFYTFVSLLDLSAVAFNIAAEYSSMPAQLIWFVNELNIPQAFAYVSSAIIIRMLLNLIPASVTRI